MRLAKLDDLKSRLGVSDTGSDTLLGSLLAGVSAGLDRYCDRTLLYAGSDATELFDGGGHDLRLKCWPVVEVSAAPVVKIATDYDFDAATAETADSDYRVQDSRGIITRLPIGSRWIEGRQIIQVVYRGGYNDPDEDPIADVDYVPAHIQNACLVQAVHLWQRRKEPGATSVSITGAGGGVSFSPDYKLLPGVKELLLGERRR